MKSVIVGLCAATMLTAAAIAAQDDPTVSITGCLEKGTHRDGYVITRLTENGPGNTAKAPSVIYWLSTTKGLHDHLGEMVQVAGTVRPDDDKGRMGKVKAQVDGTTGETKIAVETGMKKAEVVNPDLPVGTTGSVVTKVEIERPVLILHVKSLKMIEPSCRVGS